MESKVRPRLLSMIAACCLLALPATAAPPGGGDEGTDTLPAALAAMETPSGLVLATVDGSTLVKSTLAQVAQAASIAHSTATVGLLGGGSFMVAAGPDGGADLASAVLAAVGARVATVSAPAVDTHPAQPEVTFNLKKDITTSKGEQKTIYATLRVPKRSGELPEEHAARAQAELEKWMEKGWESVP